MSDTFSVLYHDLVGSAQRPAGPNLESIAIPRCLALALNSFYGATVELSPPQQWAIDHGVLLDRAHFLISAPTNSGKTLIAVLRAFAGAIERGERTVYVVPLKALAEEKAEEFREISRNVAKEKGPEVGITVSTGDYQLTEDFLGSPPPERGEIIICTPERLEVILRNTNYEAWAHSIRTYVLDEFHLLGDSGRGATFETLATRILLNCQSSSILALSATIGGIGRIREWLGHTGSEVRCLESTFRFPELHRWVVLAPDKNKFVLEYAESFRSSLDRNLLIFVYRKRDAERLAETLSEQFGGDPQVAFFHAGLPLQRRLKLMNEFRNRSIRILVTTTSLKMGVNTPATAVVARDTLFHGSGRLRTPDLLQMLGRAGRGVVAGDGYVVLAPGEEDCNYAQDFATGRIEELVGQLASGSKKARRSTNPEDESETHPLHAIYLTEIVRRGQATPDELSAFLSHTFSVFSRNIVLGDVGSSISMLETGKLIYRVENSEGIYAPTKLGRTVCLSGLSPESGAMLAGFLRALINLSEKQKKFGTNTDFLRRMTPIDLFFLAVSSYEARQHWLSKSTKRQSDQDQEYLEALPVEAKPLVNLWRSEDSQEYPTHRLIATLRIPCGRSDRGKAESLFYRVMGTAILLDKHAKGQTLDDLAQEYDVYSGDLENGLKYTVSWVLSCLAEICDPEKCYKLESLALRIRELIEDLRFGANLGKLLALKGVGRGTVEKLLASGILSMDVLKTQTAEELTALGLAGPQVVAISLFVARLNR